MYPFLYLTQESMPRTHCTDICEQIPVVKIFIGSNHPVKAYAPSVDGKIFALIHALRVSSVNSAHDANRSN